MGLAKETQGAIVESKREHPLGSAPVSQTPLRWNIQHQWDRLPGHPDEQSAQRFEQTVLSDPESLRAALVRESHERHRAECLARMQTEVVRLALDLLAREPDVERFFAELTKTLVDESESGVCGVWLLDEDHQRCEFWMARVGDELYTRGDDDSCDTRSFPCEEMARHLFAYTPGWSQTIQYDGDDLRLPEVIRQFNGHHGARTLVVAPLVIAGRNLGWMHLCALKTEDDGLWWRVVLVEAMARQATLALHQSRLVRLTRLEERRKATLEERNRLARDIHDNLAQGFAAILMQLQGAKRHLATVPPSVASSVETAVELARIHMIEARRSVLALRPNVGSGEDVAAALKRLGDVGQRTTDVPIEVIVDELPRFGDGVEREIIGIAQEALTNAVRHARARRITVRASTVGSIGLRLSVADDGDGIGEERAGSGFGMTSMQERAEKIGASLTIVTAPRSGTEVVVAWEPSSVPTQVHVAN
jgi:signal transduction histidine kinase